MELYYNPEQMRESEIKDTFVARQWMLEELLSTVKKQPEGAGVQHVILIGPRGMGKTTMLLMLRFGIVESELAEKWIAVRFPEESYSVTDLADFWIAAIAHLSYEVNDPELLAKVDGLKTDSRNSTELAGAAVATLKDWSRKNGKRIAILVDNLDLMLEQIRDENENARLREVLMNDGTFMLVGTATSFFKEARGYEQPLYNFFKTYDLNALDGEQVDELLRRRAAADNNAGFEELMKRNAGRIRVLRYFTGGSPRLVLMLYRIVASGEPVDVKRGLEKLLDEVTPYYKAKIEVLPPQQRKILDNIARVSGKTHEGLTPTQIAAETRLPVNQVSSQLKRLSELGYVAAANVRSKNSYYSLAEPLYAIWHQMRFGRGNRQRLDWLVEFLKGWYSDDEGLAQCGKLAEAFKGLIGDVGRVKEILAGSDVLALEVSTISELEKLGTVEGERLAVTIADRAERIEELHNSIDDPNRQLLVLTKLKPYFYRLPILWLRSAKALRSLGRLQDALHDCNLYLSHEQNEYAELLRAILLFELRDYESAQIAARHLLNKNPSSPAAVRIECISLDITGHFDEALAVYSMAFKNGILEATDEPPGLRRALLDDTPGVRSSYRLILLLLLADYGGAERLWRAFADDLRHPAVSLQVSAMLPTILSPNNLSFIQRLINSTPTEEIFLPIDRAIDYLSSHDRNVIEKLSAEVRPIVQEIVDEYEKKHPPKELAIRRQRTRKVGA